MKKLLKSYLPLIIGRYVNLLSSVAPKKATIRAFYLFCNPRKGNVLVHQQLFLEEAKDRIITYKGTKIQTYQWKGSGKTILLVHGWESNSFRWKKLIVKLQKNNYNIIAMDAPAHGNSSGTSLNVPLYMECLQKVADNYAPKVIIGHSIGGMTTIYHQHMYPNIEIEKLIIMAAPSELSRIMNDYKNMLQLKPSVMKKLEAYFVMQFGFNFSKFSAAQFSKNITQPGLIIHDESDSIAPVNESEAIHRNWKNATFIKTNGLDHSLQDKRVYQHILDFIKEH